MFEFIFHQALKKRHIMSLIALKANSPSKDLKDNIQKIFTLSPDLPRCLYLRPGRRPRPGLVPGVRTWQSGWRVAMVVVVVARPGLLPVRMSPTPSRPSSSSIPSMEAIGARPLHRVQL